MKIKNVIFDLDGTLIDTSNGIIESIQYTISVMKLTGLPEKTLMSFIGPPLWKSFMNHCACSKEQAHEATHIFRQYYQSGAVLHAKLYQGVLEMCAILANHGIKMGAATNKPQRFAVELIEHFGLDTYCCPVYGADEEGKLSKADLIRLCMKEMKADKLNTVLIGDTENDAIGAKQTGIPFLAVTYGFGFWTETKKMEYSCIGISDSPLQIVDVLLTI